MIDERYSSSQWSALHGHGMACAHGAMRMIMDEHVGAYYLLTYGLELYRPF